MLFVTCSLSNVDLTSAQTQVVIDREVGRPCGKANATDDNDAKRIDPHFGGDELVNIDVASSGLEL